VPWVAWLWSRLWVWLFGDGGEVTAVAVSKVAEVTAARATSGDRSPSATFTSWTPALNDLVILFCSDNLQGRTIAIPSGWINPLGGTTDVESDAHEMCAVYHWVTQAEVDAVTMTYTATDLYDASVTTGRTSGIVLRGVDTTTPIDGSGTWSITTNSTSHHFPAVVAGDVTFSNDLVVRAVAHDGTGAYTNPAAHTVSTNDTATQSMLVSTRDALTTAGVAVADTTVTQGTTGEGVGITLAVAQIPPPLQLIQELDGQSQTGNQTFTATLAQVDDLIVLIQADNFYTLANLITPTGTAVTTWTEQTANGLPVDGGTNDNHARVWTGTVTTAGGTVIANRTNTDDEGYAAVFVLRGTAGTPEFDTGDGSESDANATTHVAPSLTPTSGKTDDFLLCVWGTLNAPVNYTLPGGMTAYTEQDVGGINTYRAGSEQLTTDSATGTRTATSSVNTTWFAVSVLVKTAGGGNADKTDADSGTGAEVVAARIAVTTDTGTGSEATGLARAVSDSGTGTETALLTVPKTDFDTGTGTETVAASTRATSDAGTGAEAVAARTTPVADSGTGTDSATLTAAFTVTDGGTGTEAASTAVGVTASDSGTGSEAASLAAALAVVDTGTGTESVAARSSIVADSGTGAESASLSIAGQDQVGSDSGTGTESVSARIAQTTDSGTGSESSSLAVQVTDSGTGTETVTSRALTATDAGIGAESASLSIAGQDFNAADGGTGSEAVKALVATTADIGTGSEAVATFTRPVSDSGTGTESAAVLVPKAAADSGTGTESAVVSVALTAVEIATGIEAISTFLKTAADGGVGTETGDVPPVYGIDWAKLRPLVGQATSRSLATVGQARVLAPEAALRPIVTKPPEG